MKITAQTQLFSHVSLLDKSLFTKHMSIMLKSGITILEGLDILISQTKSEAFKQILTEITTDIKNGMSFAKALEKHPKIFDRFYVSIVEIGESSGTLDESLEYLTRQLGKEYTFRRKVKGILLYPAIVLTTTAIVGLSISIFVLPKLLDLFKDLDIPLPLSTRILLSFASIMRSYGILILILIIAACLVWRFFLKTPTGQLFWQKTLLSLPLFGSIIQKSEVASFCRNMGIMIKSGLPVPTGLSIEEEILSNIIFKSYAHMMLTAINKGQSFSKELVSNNYPYIPIIATRMIAVGEETGKLDETLLYLADFFEDDIDDATKNISTIIEPVMLIIIGCCVAFVALAIISPIYQLSGGIHK